MNDVVTKKKGRTDMARSDGRPDTRPLDIDRSGNGERIRTMEFDMADAVMLASAMSIASGMALMNRSPLALRRLQHYKDFFRSLLPEDAKLLDRDGDLCEIAILATENADWTIHRIKEKEWSRTSRVVVTIGERRFTSDDLLEEDGLERIAAVVESIVPMTCRRTPREDEIGWPYIKS